MNAMDSTAGVAHDVWRLDAWGGTRIGGNRITRDFAAKRFVLRRR
jgi:hypothetical protein